MPGGGQGNRVAIGADVVERRTHHISDHNGVGQLRVADIVQGILAVLVVRIFGKSDVRIEVTEAIIRISRVTQGGDAAAEEVAEIDAAVVRTECCTCIDRGEEDVLVQLRHIRVKAVTTGQVNGLLQRVASTRDVQGTIVLRAAEHLAFCVVRYTVELGDVQVAVAGDEELASSIRAVYATITTYEAGLRINEGDLVNVGMHTVETTDVILRDGDLFGGASDRCLPQLHTAKPNLVRVARTHSDHVVVETLLIVAENVKRRDRIGAESRGPDTRPGSTSVRGGPHATHLTAGRGGQSVHVVRIVRRDGKFQTSDAGLRKCIRCIVVVQRDEIAATVSAQVSIHTYIHQHGGAISTDLHGLYLLRSRQATGCGKAVVRFIEEAKSTIVGHPQLVRLGAVVVDLVHRGPRTVEVPEAGWRCVGHLLKGTAIVHTAIQAMPNETAPTAS